MRIMQMLILATFLILTAAIGTQISAQSGGSGAPTTQPTANANDDLRECTQMLDQSIAEVRALKEKMRALEQLRNLDSQIISKKDEIIAGQKKLIDEYEKRKGLTVSFLFGLIKFRKN